MARWLIAWVRWQGGPQEHIGARSVLLTLPREFARVRVAECLRQNPSPEGQSGSQTILLVLLNCIPCSSLSAPLERRSGFLLLSLDK